MKQYIAGLMILLVAGAAQATTYRCPELIDEEARTAKPLNGFEGWDFKEEEDEDHPLEWITLYSGHPKEQASLKPDNGDDAKAVHQVWTMSPSEHGYWLLCGYNRTRLTYIRKVEATKQCKTINDAKTKKPVGLECN